MSGESNERSKEVAPEESVEISKRSRSQDSSVSEDASAHIKKPKLASERVEEVEEQSEGSQSDLSKDGEGGNSSVTGDSVEKEHTNVTSTETKEEETKDSEKDDAAQSTDGETKKSENAGKLKFGESSTYSSGFGIASKPFGSSTTFGSGFGILKKDEDKSKDDTTNSTNTDAKKPLSFGSGLAFGSGFNVLKQENSSTESAVGKNPTQKESGNNSSRQISEETDDANNSSNTSLKLTKQVIQSGEEAENSVYQANAKLYQLTDIKEGWKERGVGPVHVNKDKNTSKARLVMRSRGLLKVILNLPLVKGFSIQKGFPGSLQGEKFVRLLALDEKGNPVQYALKTAKAEVADELFTTVKNLIPE